MNKLKVREMKSEKTVVLLAVTNLLLRISNYATI